MEHMGHMKSNTLKKAVSGIPMAKIASKVPSVVSVEYSLPKEWHGKAIFDATDAQVRDLPAGQ
jgi:hypothetical protein